MCDQTQSDPLKFNTNSEKEADMPYIEEYREPKLFLTYNFVAVYHTYKNNEVEGGPMTFWYSLDSEQTGGPEDIVSFDVRDLSTWEAGEFTSHYSQTGQIVQAITAAIATGGLDQFKVEDAA
jgi:hypothetical protein